MNLTMGLVASHRECDSNTRKIVNLTGPLGEPRRYSVVLPLVDYSCVGVAEDARYVWPLTLAVC